MAKKNINDLFNKRNALLRISERTDMTHMTEDDRSKLFSCIGDIDKEIGNAEATSPNDLAIQVSLVRGILKETEGELMGSEAYMVLRMLENMADIASKHFLNQIPAAIPQLA